jgi:hypothetical protein
MNESFRTRDFINIISYEDLAHIRETKNIVIETILGSRESSLARFVFFRSICSYSGTDDRFRRIRVNMSAMFPK